MIWYIMLGVSIFGLYLKNLFAGIIFETYIKNQSMMEHGSIMSPEERRMLSYEVSPHTPTHAVPRGTACTLTTVHNRT